MNRTDIQQATIGHFLTLDLNGLPVIWDNAPNVDIHDDQPYAFFVIRMGDERKKAIGPKALRELLGRAHFTIYAPLQTGTGDMIELIDRVSEHFRDVKLHNGELRFEGSFTETFSDKNYVAMTVKIAMRAFV